MEENNKMNISDAMYEKFNEYCLSVGQPHEPVFLPVIRTAQKRERI